MDEKEHEPKSPIKRLGSTRKLLVFNNIRLQLNEQLRCLDLRMEAQVALVMELQDFFRRRGELELDYSKNLDKLAKGLQLRHKEQKQKREQWSLFSSYACWQQLVKQTKNLSRDHAVLSEVYSTHLVNRLSQVIEDVQRIYKRCREIGYETHEEILRVLHELHTTMKTYNNYQLELRQAELKLRTAETQREKLEQTLPQDKLERSKKYKLIEKELVKRKNKYTDAKLKALKARNEYILCLEASNTTIHKYFVDDLSDLIDCMDFGFHNCVSRALLMHVSAEEGRQKSVQSGLDAISACVNSLDSRLDKQRFLEYNHAAFMIPKKIEFQGQKTDELPLEPEIQKVLHQEMESRLNQLQKRLTTLRTESEEVWKTLETAELTLLEMLNSKDYDCSNFFNENYTPPKPTETSSMKQRADRQETEEFYLTKFREYLLGSTRISRLDAKQEYIQQSLLADALECKTPAIKHVSRGPRRKRIGRLQSNGQPKLFGGSLEEYLEATNQEIPLIMQSCIRVINLFGLHHQGIFRVSGSQIEINNFREWFERGEDPLSDVTDASDINSVAGVFKLYLRELREPLFPIIYFDHFMELAQLESKHEFIVKIRELVQSLPKSVMIVMRYLFAFLNHLSEFSDENMMDPYNLAICFGPTLVPVPDDKDQVQYQNQVNELIKNIIMHNEEIFPNNGGICYEKYISTELDDQDIGDSPSDHGPDDLESEVYPSEDDSENMEATVQFDFIARSDREVSLKKGDSVLLYTQVSNDWWRGSVNGQEGLIPDKYISLKIKDEEKEKNDNVKIRPSDDSVKRKASNSNIPDFSENSVQVVNFPEAQCAQISWINNISREGTVTMENRSAPLTSQSREVVASVTPMENSINKNSLVLKNEKTNCTQTTDSSQNSETECHELPVAEVQTVSASLNEEINSSIDQSGIEEEMVNFIQNVEKWQKRVDSFPEKNIVPLTKQSSVSKTLLKRQNDTPDLVMDLPLVTNIVKETPTNLKKSLTNVVTDNLHSEADSPTSDLPENSYSLGSPDMQTAAERFAKQNQCTLKKNTKTNYLESLKSDNNTIFPGDSVVPIPKPQVKIKPLTLKKPVSTTSSNDSSSAENKEQLTE